MIGSVGVDPFDMQGNTCVRLVVVGGKFIDQFPVDFSVSHKEAETFLLMAKVDIAVADDMCILGVSPFSGKERRKLLLEGCRLKRVIHVWTPLIRSCNDVFSVCRTSATPFMALDGRCCVCVKDEVNPLWGE